MDAERRYALLGFRIIAEFGAAIAIPAVLAAVIGKRLDAAYGTSPKLLATCVVVAFAMTAAHIVRRTKAFADEYEAINALTQAKAPEKPAQPPDDAA